MKIKTVRGTHDLYGENIIKFNKIKSTISKFAKLYSFLEIQTPIFELTELFSKPLGEQSDVVLKEMYTFKDRNDDLLTLRPEYTTPMIRSAISNNLLNDLPLKTYGIGPMFRRERPQKGRYRQFNQVNFEIFGTSDSTADLELIVLANEILKSLLPNSNILLHINSLEKKENLQKYKDILSNYYNDNSSKLSEESKNKIFKNPLRILDSKFENDIELSKKAPSINDYISLDEKKHFEEIKEGLKFYNIKFKENYKLVRGLDYYCSTVFEFKTEDLGSQDTLLGGGRYDGLINNLGGPDIPGIGWAAGVERISILMGSINIEKADFHIAIQDQKFKPHLIKILKYLKDNKISYYWNYKYNIKKSLSKANQNKISHAVIIGENEFSNNYYTIKNLINGDQIELKINQIKKYLDDQS